MSALTSDPTDTWLFDQVIPERNDLCSCPSCGAVVTRDDVRRHKDWHKALTDRVRTAAGPIGFLAGGALL